MTQSKLQSNGVSRKTVVQELSHCLFQSRPVLASREKTTVKSERQKGKMEQIM